MSDAVWWWFAIAAAFILGRAWRPKAKPVECAHQWKLTGTRQAVKIDRKPQGGEDKRPITQTLEVCARCGHSRTGEMAGWWSHDQLTAPVDAAEVVRRELGI